MMAKDVILCYNNSKIDVHCVFFNSSKALISFNYCKFFNLLLNRHIPPHLIRLLHNMYKVQQVNGVCNAVLSRMFAAVNG